MLFVGLMTLMFCCWHEFWESPQMVPAAECWGLQLRGALRLVLGQSGLTV